jgi:DNA polymerase-3 subunit delta'
VSRNSTILEGLRRASAEGRLHHAYILGGPEGSAKQDCVQQFAAELFAAGGGGLFGGAGSVEDSLRRVQSRNHPDFTVLEPVNDKIGVDEVRELPRILAFPPLEAPRRVILIVGAGSMNVQAANAILKILEEPPAHTMFFLLCRDPAELLPTIVSRGQVLRFAPLSREEILKSLGDVAEPDTVVGWSEGSLERARALLAGEEGLLLRRQACENLLDLWEAAPRVPASVAHWAETQTEESACLQVVDCWEILLRDFLFTVAGAGESDLRFRDFYSRLKALAGRTSDAVFSEAASKQSFINRFRVYRGLNGNLRLDLVALLVELQLNSMGKKA